MKRSLKIASTVLSLALATAITPICSVNAAETTTDKIILGDVNYDGVVNVLDTTEIQLYVACLDEFTDDQKFVADTNADGRINILDATEVQRYAAECGNTNENIGKTWHDAEYETVTVPGETTTEPKLRYDYVNCEVCNKCLEPMMHKDGTTFNNEEVTAHMFREHNGGSWHSSDHWFYVDDNGIYHDLSDDWKLPNMNYSNKENPPADKYWDEGSMNVFDIGFNPYNGSLTQEIYNNEHEDKLDYYWTAEIHSICRYCNYDGSSIFDEWGGCGNQIVGDDGRPLFLTLTEPVEITYYPDSMADMTALNNAFDTAKQAVADHEAWHKEQNNLPDYLKGVVDTAVLKHDRIYTTVKTTTEPTTKTVLVRDAGWY